MIDPDMATDQELRRYLNENGVPDFEMRVHRHPSSQKLREAGLRDEADILDDFYQKFTEKGVGLIHVCTKEECCAKAKQLMGKLHAKQNP